MDDLRSRWSLDPSIAYLNHGSYGACSVAVLEVQSEWRARLEREPVPFFSVDYPVALDRARQATAAFVGAAPADLVFVANATTALNTVLRSLERELRPGDELLTTDHEYNATHMALAETAARTGARLVIARLPFPALSAGAIRDAIMDRVTERTRLALVSHITSATAIVMPAAEIAAALADRGVPLLLDGAHGPGQVPVDLRGMGATWYAANGHKWLCAPKGAGFLVVRPERQAAIRPLVISHGRNARLSQRSRFLEEADWTGTADPSAILSLPAAMEHMATLHPDGWAGVMQANREMCLRGREAVRAAVDSDVLVADELTGAMAPVELPVDLPPVPDSDDPAIDDELQRPLDPLGPELRVRYSVEVPVYAWPVMPRLGAARRLLRISAQRYTTEADFDRLARALTSVLIDQGNRSGGDDTLRG